MARIPRYAFRCVIFKKDVAGRQPPMEIHNYENLPGAWAFREIALRKWNTKRVEILLVLDESTPEHSV